MIIALKKPALKAGFFVTNKQIENKWVKQLFYYSLLYYIISCWLN